MATTDKLAALAFAPSAAEGEAVNAFLALRRMGYNPTAAPQPAKCSGYGDKSTATWNLKIPAKSFDLFFKTICEFRDEPFCTFKTNEFRSRLIDRWDIQLKVFFDTDAEVKVFTQYLEIVFKSI